MEETACAPCGGTGYAGRVGIFEFLTITPVLQRLIYERTGTTLLRREACALGMCTLREDGLRKVRAGLTSREEVLAATVADANGS